MNVQLDQLASAAMTLSISARKPTKIAFCYRIRRHTGLGDMIDDVSNFIDGCRIEKLWNISVLN